MFTKHYNMMDKWAGIMKEEIRNFTIFQSRHVDLDDQVQFHEKRIQKLEIA